MKTLDMKGQPCPIPVISAKNELKRNDAKGVILLVDNIVAVQNLEKMANGIGCEFAYTAKGSDFEVRIIKMGELFYTSSENVITADESDEESNGSSAIANHAHAQGVVVLVKSNQMGHGSEELGKILIKGFLFSLTELSVPPKAILFLNSGVQLTASGSNTISDLQTLANKGTKVLACGTCLNYYSLTNDLAVGEIVDMFSITGYLSSAKKVISI